MNAYASQHGDRIADEVEVVLPIAGEDVVAHSQRVLQFEFVTSRGGVEASIDDWAKTEKGSNAWATGPPRSASGRAMLVANPHLPWTSFFSWFEAQLNAPGIDACGATLVGMPIPTGAGVPGRERPWWPPWAAAAGLTMVGALGAWAALRGGGTSGRQGTG